MFNLTHARMPVSSKSVFFALALSLPLLSRAAQPAASWPSIPGPFSSAAWAIGDFDGDGRFDLLTASLSLTAPGPSGLTHLIELRSASSPGVTSSFLISGGSASLSLAAWDVDGDHDLDLVVTSALFHRPVGVWINDGRGGFTEASLDTLPAAEPFPSLRNSVSPAPFFNSAPLFLPRPKQPCAALCASAIHLPARAPSFLLPRRSPARIAARLFAPSAPRAPPGSLSA